MANLHELVEFLDRELRVSEIADYPGAMNGLQLANEGRVDRVVAAVDASLPVIEAVAAGGPGLLIVHHGMFWQGAQPVTGAFYRKLHVAMEAGLAIYSSHLPLDVHPEWGNNALLAEALGVIDPQADIEIKGFRVGLSGRWQGSREELKARLENVLGGRVHLCPGGPEQISRVAIITGGAGSEIAKIAETGVDAFITGEGPHWSYCLAEELGVNLFYGGHYATETFGVQRVAKLIGERFGLPWSFYDNPTGL
jgi:dinuclear metal center YbgI/SA1388 family protein